MNPETGRDQEETTEIERTKVLHQDLQNVVDPDTDHGQDHHAARIKNKLTEKNILQDLEKDTIKIPFS